MAAKFLPYLLAGISVGGQYALIAIGYTMVYGILRLINFAHGDIFTVAGFLMVYATASLPLTVSIPLVIAAIVCGILYSQMKTAKLKTEANDYIGAGLKLRVKDDFYTHTDRVQVYDPPAPENDSSGGSSVDSDGFGGSSGGSF